VQKEGPAPAIDAAKIANQLTATKADRLMILVPIRFDRCFHLYSRVANQELSEPLTATEKNLRVHISAIRLR
jgi:hypothetical protein